MSATNFSASTRISSVSITAHDFVGAAQIAAVLPARTLSAGAAVTLPSLAGGSASHLISVAASTPGGGVHVYTHVS